MTAILFSSIVELKVITLIGPNFFLSVQFHLYFIFVYIDVCSVKVQWGSS
jgi:hypothetical protein